MKGNKRQLCLFTALALCVFLYTMTAFGVFDAFGSSAMPETYTIRFHDDFMPGQDVIFDLEAAGAAMIDLPVPPWEHEGYVFAGWYTNNAGVNHELANVYSAGEAVKDLAVPGEIVNLYAGWQLINYSITYDYGGGYVNGENPESYTVESEDISLISPSKKGYVFAGWKSGPETLNDVKIPKGSTGSRHFEAVFTPGADTKYHVFHETMNEDGTGYTVREIETFEGVTESVVTPATRSYEGYISPEGESVKIKADGSTVVVYKYIRAAAELNDGDIIVLHCYRDPSLVLDQGGVTGTESPFSAERDEGKDSAKFIVSVNDDGSITLISYFSGLALDVKHASREKGTEVWQYMPNGTAAQRWEVEANAGNAYVIFKSKVNNKLCLSAGERIYGGAQAVNGTQDMAGSRWCPETVGKVSMKAGEYLIRSAVGKGFYLGVNEKDPGIDYGLIQNRNAGGILDLIRNAPGENGRIVIAKKGKGGTAFTLEYGVCGTFRLRSPEGFYADVAGNAAYDHTPLWLHVLNNTEAQNFIITVNPDKTVSFTGTGSSKKLDVYGAIARTGNMVSVYHGNGTKAQRWYLEKKNDN